MTLGGGLVREYVGRGGPKVLSATPFMPRVTGKMNDRNPKN